MVAKKRAHVKARLDERRKGEALDLYEKRKAQQPLREKTPGWHTKPVARLHQASVCVEDAPARLEEQARPFIAKTSCLYRSAALHVVRGGC